MKDEGGKNSHSSLDFGHGHAHWHEKQVMLDRFGTRVRQFTNAEFFIVMLFRVRAVCVCVPDAFS